MKRFCVKCRVKKAIGRSSFCKKCLLLSYKEQLKRKMNFKMQDEEEKEPEKTEGEEEEKVEEEEETA